nr:MAG TPA: Cell Wall Hydrolase [Caudoviricetes sp.]
MKYIKLILLSLLFILPVSIHAHYTGRVMDHLARSDGKINSDPLDDFLNRRNSQSNHQATRDRLGEFINRRGLTKPQRTRISRQRQHSQPIANNNQTNSRDELGELITRRAETARSVSRPAVQNLGNYEREVYSLALMMYHECYSCGTMGMTHVANATLNRVNNPEFPNTVYAVISQRGQYQWFHNHRLRGKNVFSPVKFPEVMELARHIYNSHLNGTRHDTTNGAIFFSSNGVRPAPRAVNPVKLAGHTFYRLRPLHRNRDI